MMKESGNLSLTKDLKSDVASALFQKTFLLLFGKSQFNKVFGKKPKIKTERIG